LELKGQGYLPVAALRLTFNNLLCYDMLAVAALYSATGAVFAHQFSPILEVFSKDVKSLLLFA
jgi:hypothetical protein